MASEGNNKFCVKRTAQYVNESIASEREILLDKYVLTYTELTKFIDTLGTVFGFVNKDVNEKLGILRHHLQGPAGSNYRTVQSMVEYEVSNKLTLKKTTPPNGCRSLLRLNRALEFLMGFLAILQEDDSPDVPFANAVHNCYKGTLAKYHAWIIQKGVALALYTLPHKEKLVEMMSDGLTEEEFQSQTVDMVQKLKVMYESVQKCYKEYDLLDLP